MTPGAAYASSVLRTLHAPAWVTAGPPDSDTWPVPGRADPAVRVENDLAYLALRIERATALDAAGLEAAVERAYRALAGEMAVMGGWSPVRYWNYIPDIHGPMGDGLTRYMVFNAGRYRAMSDWAGGPTFLANKVPTATGVGHNGEDLHVYCLAARSPGRPIENPRQVPAYRYSRRYGPVPPCFARATVVNAGTRRALLVGGTASVRGEHSVAGTGIEEQLLETFTNLATLVAAVFGNGQAGEEPPESPWLERFRQLRAYCVRPEHAAVVRAMVLDRLRSLDILEVVEARVCRPELMVEIEGVAEGDRA